MKQLFTLLGLLLVVQSVSAQDPAYPPAPAAPGNVVKAEYFFDNDPGFGSGVNIPVSASTDIANLLAAVNVSSLTNGAHRIYLRTLNVEGNWSISSVAEFIVDFNPSYPLTPASPGNIVKAEYFLDTDPGFGNGVSIPISPATDLSNVLAAVNTSSLAVGIHRIYLRTLNIEGKWSLSEYRELVVDFDPAYPATPAAPGNIVKAEYFLDTDPGFNNGINIPVTPATDISNLVASINVGGFSNGAHNIYLRTLNVEGKWSITSVGQFLYDADPAYSAAPAAPGNITDAEYFFDTDPGFGNGLAVPVTPAVDVSNRSFSADVSALPDGNHILYIRSKDDWSITSMLSFFKGIALPLHFLSFTGKKINNNILLNWSTDNEVNTSHFDIERSSNGTDFNKTGSTTAFNRSGRNDYSFMDVQPLMGLNYYRLKQIDRDGQFVYSPVVRISTDGSELLFSISPNPANNFINVVYPGKKEIVTSIIYDAQGRLLKKQSQRNELPVKIAVQDLDPGIYFISLSDGETIVKGKFMIQ